MDTSILQLQHQVTASDGVSLCYRDFAPANARPTATIVMLHGLASAGVQFERTAWHLAQLGYRVIVPDLRGHGLSGVPDGLIKPAAFSMAQMADDVLRMLDAAGIDTVHWLGNSLGGILALHLLGTPAKKRLKTLALFGTCFSMRLPALAANAVRWPFAVIGKGNTARLTALMTTGDKAGRGAITEAINQFNPAAGQAIASHVRAYDLVDNALGYKGPMLLMRGGRDRAVNLGLRRDIGRFIGRPNFRLVELPKAGHCANLDVHDDFCRALAQFIGEAG